MSTPAGRFAAAAEALIGTPYRLGGRCRVSGVDCVGLVALALEDSGRKVVAPVGYGLRNATIAPFLQLAIRNGFFPAQRAVERGDILLVASGPGQSHLLVALTHSAAVHAHAGLRRVARHDAMPAWPILHHWRLDAQ